MLRSLSAMIWIGWYGFLETLRNRLLLGVALLVLPMLGASMLLNSYDLGFQAKIVKDIGLNIISIFGLFVVLILSLDQIIPDIERRSIYFILARMSRRGVYLVGRFLGVAASLAFYQTVMGALLVLLLYGRTGVWYDEIMLGVFVLFLKQCVLLAVILMLATFTSKIVIMSLGILLYSLGHTYDLIRMLAEKQSNTILSRLIEFFAFFLPDFSLYEIRVNIVHELPFQTSSLVILTVYTSALCMFYLALGGNILSRRDL
ncbi:MAG: hypothetical protein ACOYM3_00120 [Terrimicrobiaceae bacterium]